MLPISSFWPKRLEFYASFDPLPGELYAARGVVECLLAQT